MQVDKCWSGWWVLRGSLGYSLYFCTKSTIKYLKSNIQDLSWHVSFLWNLGWGRCGKEEIVCRKYLESLPENHHHTQYSSSIRTHHSQVGKTAVLADWSMQFLRCQWDQLDCPHSCWRVNPKWPLSYHGSLVYMSILLKTKPLKQGEKMILTASTRISLGPKLPPCRQTP